VILKERTLHWGLKVARDSMGSWVTLANVGSILCINWRYLTLSLATTGIMGALGRSLAITALSPLFFLFTAHRGSRGGFNVSRAEKLKQATLEVFPKNFGTKEDTY